MLDPLSQQVQQWLFLPAHLASTPSAKDRIDTAKELDARRKGVALITSLLARLGPVNPARRAPEHERRNEVWRAVDRDFVGLNSAKDVATTASVFFHRFYMRHTMRAYPIEVIAPACLYLALKIEERPSVKIHHVARATKKKLDEHNEHEEAYYANQIAGAEDTLLEALCYDLVLDQPLAALLRGAGVLSRHRPLVEYARAAQIPGASDAKGKAKEGSAGPSTPAAAAPNKASGSSRAAPFPLVSSVPSAPSSAGGLGTPNPYFPAGGVGAGARTPVPGLANGQKAKPSVGPEEPSERADRVVLELAYLVCYETISSPLCLLALPQYIAAASLVLALSLAGNVHRFDVLHRVDETWVQAFGGGLGMTGERGLWTFKETLSAAVELIVKYGQEDRLVTDGFGKKLVVAAQPTVFAEVERNTAPSPGKPPDTLEAGPTGQPGEHAEIAGKQPGSNARTGQQGNEDVEMADASEGNPTAQIASANEAGLSIPPPDDAARPKTATVLRAEIFDGSGLTEVPITQQVGRDVADITSQLLDAGNTGLAVDELGMSGQMTADEAVLDVPVETETQQL